MSEPNFRATTNRLISLMNSTEGKFLEAEIMATLVDMYGRGFDDGERKATIGVFDLPSGRKMKIRESNNA